MSQGEEEKTDLSVEGMAEKIMQLPSKVSAKDIEDFITADHPFQNKRLATWVIKMLGIRDSTQGVEEEDLLNLILVAHGHAPKTVGYRILRSSGPYLEQQLEFYLNYFLFVGFQVKQLLHSETGIIVIAQSPKPFNIAAKPAKLITLADIFRSTQSSQDISPEEGEINNSVRYLIESAHAQHPASAKAIEELVTSHLSSISLTVRAGIDHTLDKALRRHEENCDAPACPHGHVLKQLSLAVKQANQQAIN